MGATFDGPVIHRINVTASPSSITYGNSVYLTCSSSYENGTPYFLWKYKTSTSGWTNITSGTTSISFTPPSPGTYTIMCYLKVTSKLDKSFYDESSDTATVYVSDPIITPTKPTATVTGGGKVQKGSPVTLICSASGNGILSYQWASEAGRITGATSYIYSPPTSTIGEYTYYCTVINTTSGGSRSEESNSVTVNVVKGPDTPSNVSISGGGTYSIGAAVTLTCNATGDGTLSYAWNKIDSNGVPRPTGATGATYAPSTSEVGTAYYSCAVTNTLNGFTASATSGSVMVKVEDAPTAPTVTISGGGEHLADGSVVTLTASASATVAGTFTYQWGYKDSSTGDWRDLSGKTEATYTLSATLASSTQYRCTVTNTKSGTSVSGYGYATVTFLLPADTPVASIAGPSGNVYKGGRAIITCTATGNGTLSYQWANEQGYIAGATASTYSVPTDKAAIYSDIYCIVQNKVLTSAKTVETNHVTVEVLDTPVPSITSQSIASATYALNAEANAMTIAATSEVGSIIYHWQSSEDNTNFADISGQTGQSFTPSTANVGTVYYRCRVVNSYLGHTKETTSNVATIKVVAVPKPSFTSSYNMSSARYYLNQQANALNASASASMGTISYKWQFSYDGTSWQNAGLTGPTATPATSNLGTVYYRCIVTNSLNGETSTIYSDTAMITVSGAPAPVLNRDNANVNCYIGDTSAYMSVAASTAAGMLTYQWQQLSGSLWAPIAGAIFSTYYPPATAIGSAQYKCVITNTYQGLTSTVSSSAATFTVLDTPTPTFTQTNTLKSAAYKQNATAAALDATATVPQGTVTYQWQKRGAENGEWENIEGQTNAQYTPPTAEIGTETYRCVAQNTLFERTKGSETPALSISVDYAVAPVPEFTADANVADAYYYLRGTANPMNASATAPVGTISYQWQRSATGGAWEDITNAASATYTPPITELGAVYYRCRVQNTYDNTTSTLYSNEALITVREIPTPYFENTETLRAYTYWQGASATTLSVTAKADAGSVSCYWQMSTDRVNWSAVTASGMSAYTPSTATLGTAYYRAVAINRLNGYTAQATSPEAIVLVRATEPPVITGQPEDGEYTVMAAANPLQAAYTSETEPVTFQWQQSTDGSTWNDIPGATKALYVPSTATADTQYYRVQMYAGNIGYQIGVTSDAAAIIVTVGEPGFLHQPQSADYNLRANPQALNATAYAPGCTLSYQWQTRENASADWRNIIGAEESTYFPPTAPRGSTQYRCVVTATNNGQSETVYSNTATITVSGGQAPIYERRLSDSTYSAGDTIYPLNGTASSQDTNDITYQWYWSRDNETFYPVDGGTFPIFTPNNAGGGTSYYYVIATARFADGTTAQSQSNTAVINIVNASYQFGSAWRSYLETLKTNFVKLARLEFLQPDGSVAFALDNNPMNRRSGAFIQSGQLTVNLQNGKRRTATVTLANLDGEFDYNVNKVWFGQQILLSEGLMLPNGQEFYLPQGVFYIREPEEKVLPNMRTVTYNLEDKWSYLDGTLFGNLEGIYEIPLHTNIFDAIQSVLDLDRGNGVKVDAERPIYTNYYNDQMTILPDGTMVSDLLLPYTYRNDSENGTYADIVLEMSNILAAWVGYDATGRLRIDPSQDDILDTNKPIQWEFRPDETQFLGATYTVKNTDVYNDVVIVGESLSGYGYIAGRAQNQDPRSDTNVNLIGIKTHKESAAGFYTEKQCENLAVFRLKRQTVLQKSVSIQSAQLFHISENQLVTIRRPDKPGAPLERHLVTGFTRPIAQTGVMRIDATSVNDFVSATVIYPGEQIRTEPLNVGTAVVSVDRTVYAEAR